MTSFMRYLNIDTVLTPSPTAGTTSKQVLLLGQRETSGDLILATNGFPQPNYYDPILLPSFSNGVSALNYLANYGIQFSMGIDFVLSLPAPTTVTSSNSLTTLTWSIIPSGFTQLVGFALSGTLSQASPSSVNGNVYSARIITGVATLVVYGTVAFVTAGSSGGVLTLTGVNNVNYPDPDATDPIALMVWDFYQTALSAFNSPNGAPAAYISILTDRDNTINPVSTPIVLGNPTAVTTGTTSTLTYPTSTGGLGYLPTTSLGNSTVTQTATLPSDSINRLYEANGVYLAGAATDSGGIFHSSDGVIWAATNLTTHTVTGFKWNGSVYVATTDVGVYYSVNGTTWTPSNLTSGLFTSVDYGNTKFCAGSSEGIYYSSDGITWVRCTGDGSDAFTVIFNGTGTEGFQWIAATSTGAAYTSTDGITFTVNGLTAASAFTAGLFAGELFLLTYGAGMVYSPGGVSAWIDTSGDVAHAFISLAYFGGTYFAGTTAAGIKTSPNGVVWAATSNTASTVRSFASNGTVIVAGTAAGIYSSINNGVTWTITTGSGATGNYQAVLYHNLFVAGDAAGLSISSNGLSWIIGSFNNVGTYGGFIVDGSNVIITVTGATGSFTTSVAATVVLDNTINAFAFLDNINLYGAVQQFPITDLTDITTTYADFYDGITLLNEPNQVLNKHYFTYGAAGNITSLPSAAATLPAPNNQENILVTYPYIAQFGNIPYENSNGNVAGGRVTSAVMYMLANGDAPFPPLMTATINHLPISSLASTISYSGAQNSTGDIAVNQGWLPLAPNSSNVVAFLESNTTLITIPSTTTPDIEFRYTHIWDCVRWVKQEVAELFGVISVLPNNQGSALISPIFLRQFTQGIYSILFTGENLGVVENVSLYQNLVSVTQDPTNPNQVDVYIPIQIIPQLNGANILINVFSSLYTFQNSQGV